MSSSTSRTAVSTPRRAPPTPPVTESPGTWQHPRLQEIARRQEASNFTEKNAKRMVYNIGVFVTLVVLHTVLSRILPSRRNFSHDLWLYTQYFYKASLAIPAINIAFNILPLFRRKDDFSDIPLTPGQRRLLGLPPSSAPPTPGSVYSTPPRYSRTPSISGSAGSRRSFSSSPGSNRSPSNYGSPINAPASANLGFMSPGSPLLQKAMNGARRSSLGSLGSPSPLLTTPGASLFGSGPDSPSPSPAMGKRSTVGLNSKWLYEKGREQRRTSGVYT